jgi:hypothetical protein
MPPSTPILGFEKTNSLLVAELDIFVCWQSTGIQASLNDKLSCCRVSNDASE